MAHKTIRLRKVLGIGIKMNTVRIPKELLCIPDYIFLLFLSFKTDCTQNTDTCPTTRSSFSPKPVTPCPPNPNFRHAMSVTDSFADVVTILLSVSSKDSVKFGKKSPNLSKMPSYLSAKSPFWILFKYVTHFLSLYFGLQISRRLSLLTEIRMTKRMFGS